MRLGFETLIFNKNPKRGKKLKDGIMVDFGILWTFLMVLF